MNKPLFAFGISLLVLGIGMLYGVSVAAQQPEEAPLVLVRMPTTTQFSPDQVTGVVDVLMTQQTYTEREPLGEMVGYIFDASLTEIDGIYEIPVAYFMDQDGEVSRVCDLQLFIALIPDWSIHAQAYAMGDQGDTNCLGPIPVFYSE